MTTKPSPAPPPADPLHSRPLLLAGPTAVGKSEIALLLAEKLGGEIISVDSMQVYRGMDIGTAKPSSNQRDRVAHHLVDVADVAEPFDAGQFAHLARQAQDAIRARGRLPILCGGTGLYFKAMLEGLGQTPPSDPTLRAELVATPLPVLLSELAQADPTTWERIDRQNPRRVIRAVEVIRLTGKPYSSLRADWQPAAAQPPEAPVGFGLIRPTAELHRRIDARVDEMFRAGLVSETETLLARGLAQNLNASQALGYRQVIEYLQGERSLPQTIELVKRRTHLYAKRQMTWFRGQMHLQWIEIQAGQSAADVVERLKRDA